MVESKIILLDATIIYPHGSITGHGHTLGESI